MKVKFVTLMMKMYKTLREESELIMKLKGFCPGNRIPKGILMQGPEALKNGIIFVYLSIRTIQKCKTHRCY
jgi:serine/threonine-protein phosphatase 2B catalytic subunit